jgi:hypothetical protein
MGNPGARSQPRARSLKSRNPRLIAVIELGNIPDSLALRNRANVIRWGTHYLRNRARDLEDLRDAAQLQAYRHIEFHRARAKFTASLNAELARWIQPNLSARRFDRAMRYLHQAP